MIWLIKGIPYIAVPSTMSIATNPNTRSFFSTFINSSVILIAIDPPNECPTIITFCSAYLLKIYFKVLMVSLQRVSIDKSSLLSCFLEHPWPFKSKAIRVPKCLTYLARVAKLKAEWPASWTQKKMIP
jgi:hypothetical protein